jgi:hypothetical protein
MVFDSIALCSAGCGRRTRIGVCSECARHDPEIGRQRKAEQRLRDLKAMGRSGADVTGTCLSCLNWSGRCLMDVPECSVGWAKKCSTFLPAEVQA